MDPEAVEAGVVDVAVVGPDVQLDVREGGRRRVLDLTQISLL